VKQLCRMAVAMGALLISVFAPSGPAGAAGYPPPTVPVTNSTSISVSLGSSTTVTPGCHFAPGTPITITFNGAPYATVTAPTPGPYTETFAITDPHISLNGGPLVATAFGVVNTFVASGFDISGNSCQSTTLVTVPAPAAAPVATAQPFAFSGADIAAMTIGGLALIALGFVFVVFSRRRRASASAE
jgi:hypothetical protein